MSGLRERQEEQARRYAEFVERDPSPIFEADREGRITYENPAARALFPNLAASGRNHPLLADWTRILKMLDHEPTRAIRRIVTVEERHIEQDLHLSVDRQRVRVHAVDITARVRDEEVMRRFEVIANRIPEFMTLIGPDYTYLAANEAYCRAHKLRREAIIGKRVAQVWGEEVFRTVIQGHLDRCLRGEEVSHQLWIDFPATGRRHVEVCYFPDTDAAGVVRHAVVMTRDITRVLESEEELRRREKREALARMAEAVVQGIADSAGLVEHLKTYYESPSTLPARLDLNELATRVADAPLKGYPSFRIARELGSVPPVRGHAHYLERALGLLLARAVRSVHRAKGTQPRVTIESWQEHGMAKLAVTDNGPGIPEADLVRILEPHDGDFSLAAARNLVESAGGSLEAHNAPGKGVQFVISMAPDQEDTSVPGGISRPASGDRSAPRRATIVVIDDDPVVASTIRNALGGAHEVLSFLSGREALTYLERIPPVDIIFCDLMMPGMTGMEVHAVVASRWPEYEERMVFLSGGITSLQAERFLASHSVRRCGKPLGTAALQKLVMEML